jgi:hypothetical protein
MSEREYQGYKRREIAPGVTEYQRNAGVHTTYLTDTPQIHIHYRTDDRMMDAQGYGEAEVACHGCATALIVRYPSLPPAEEIGDGWEPLLMVRREFVAEHGEHRGFWSSAGHILCPPERKHVSTLDLRIEQPAEKGDSA